MSVDIFATKGKINMQFVKHGKTGIILSLDDKVATKRIIKEIESGLYEIREANFGTRLSIPDDRILELGAGLGFISTMICSKIKPKHYSAVEADERLIPHINRTHSKNGIVGVNVIQGAFVSDPEIIDRGFVEFGVSKAFWGSGIEKVGMENIQTVRVTAHDISSYICNNGITMLISDIEGGELSVFRSIDFGSVRRIILEIHPKVYGQRGVREIFQILDRNNFVYNAPNSGGPVLTFDRLTESSNFSDTKASPAPVTENRWSQWVKKWSRRMHLRPCIYPL